MRNLTIKRNKTWVGSALPLQVYWEDAANSEITINGVPCRKLGKVKNGEEQTFAIDERAGKVFMIADRLSKGYCNEFYQIPEGQDDLFLSGQCRFNPGSGNAFRFDNNDNPEVIANRRRSNKKGWVVFIVTIAVCQVIGVALGLYLHFTRTPEPATFSSDGITLTLTDDFSAMDYDPFTATFASREVAVYALKEPFTLAEGMDSMTLDEYADIVIQNNNLSPDCKQTTNGQIHMTYDFFNEEMNTTYRYRAYVYKSDDAFWLVQFVTKAADAQAYADRVASWAGSVTFD